LCGGGCKEGRTGVLGREKLVSMKRKNHLEGPFKFGQNKLEKCCRLSQLDGRRITEEKVSVGKKIA